ncbi:DEAD/DEAH box helicase [Tabrizicola sp.]|uniref:DEAD/DEAH box helicase n=1 Tax=Tabrizicola sp. TaxID=2005166 RepID=UPI002FDEC354
MSVMETLRKIEDGLPLSGDIVFDAILEASKISKSDRYEDQEALEIAIRLLDASERGLVPYGSHGAIEHLAEECGLYPYVDIEKLNPLRASLIESFSVGLDEKVYLHAKQMEVLSHLLAGENVALSAPTSFGKSLIVDAFVQQSGPETVVAIVPTIALIDETRRRLERNFGDRYQVISKPSDSRVAERAIYVLTQERYLNRDEISKIDFLFVDEFYKLDPRREDLRFRTLNVALYRAQRVCKQFLLAGPNITALSRGPAWKSRINFIRSDYQTVTLNTVDRTTSDEKFGTFLNDLRSVGEQQSLVYSKSPPASRRLLEDLLSAGYSQECEVGTELSQWIAANYHPDWVLTDAVKNGIALHHGKIPRALAQLFVKLFNDGELPVMLCTSTLIEGVNTSAENVFVFDKEISTRPFDYFSFANIRGRVGRMMRHFVGRVFLYHAPPLPDELTVEVPVFGDPSESDDYILMNYDSGDLDGAALEKQFALPLEYEVNFETLKQFGHFGGHALQETKGAIRKLLVERPQSFEWNGFPDYNQKIALATVIRPLLSAKGDKSARLTVKQMVWAWDKLMKLGSLPDFIQWFQETFSGDAVQEGIDRALEFLSSCEFNHATATAAVNRLVSELRPTLRADYSLYALQLESWFRQPWLKELDELGVPVPLSERLQDFVGRQNNYRDALRKMSELSEDTLRRLSPIDRLLLSRATKHLRRGSALL